MGRHRSAARRLSAPAVAAVLLLTGCTATTPAEVTALRAAGPGAGDAARLLDAHTLVLTLAGTTDCLPEVVEAHESAEGEVVVETADHARHTCAGRARSTSWRISTAGDLTAGGGPRPVVVYAADGLLTVPVGSAAG